jgi:hypothetical protein
MHRLDSEPSFDQPINTHYGGESLHHSRMASRCCGCLSIASAATASI